MAELLLMEKIQVCATQRGNVHLLQDKSDVQGLRSKHTWESKKLHSLLNAECLVVLETYQSIKISLGISVRPEDLVD